MKVYFFIKPYPTQRLTHKKPVRHPTIMHIVYTAYVEHIPYTKAFLLLLFLLQHVV